MKATLHPDQSLWDLGDILGPPNCTGHNSSILKAWTRDLRTIRDLAKNTRNEWLKQKGIGVLTVDDWESLVIMAGLTMGNPGKEDREGYLAGLREKSNKAIDEWHKGEKTKYMFNHIHGGWYRVSSRHQRFLGGSARDDPKTLDPLCKTSDVPVS